MTDYSATASEVFFPLVPRLRPPGLPLPSRISRLGELSAEPITGTLCQQLTRASEICNLAALIASDCGLTSLAKDLCWRQYDIFDQARPLPADIVPLALQPLLNIPRQLIRDGDGHTAYGILENLYQAACTQGNVYIIGRIVDFRGIAATSDGFRALVTGAWTALLADGTRALTRVGRWDEAAQRIATYRGVGARLLDGRQATILAAAHRGQHDRAAELIDRSSIHEPWEHAVQHLLRVHCQHLAGTDTCHRIPAMLASVFSLLSVTGLATVLFGTRVAITALELIQAHHGSERQELLRALVKTAQQDGYAARDLLARPQLTHDLPDDQHQALAEVVRTCGLNADGAIPDQLYEEMLAAVAYAERCLQVLLTVDHRS